MQRWEMIDRVGADKMIVLANGKSAVGKGRKTPGQLLIDFEDSVTTYEMPRGPPRRTMLGFLGQVRGIR